MEKTSLSPGCLSFPSLLNAFVEVWQSLKNRSLLPKKGLVESAHKESPMCQESPSVTASGPPHKDGRLQVNADPSLSSSAVTQGGLSFFAPAEVLNCILLRRLSVFFFSDLSLSLFFLMEKAEQKKKKDEKHI